MYHIIFDLELNQAYRAPTNNIVKQEIVEIGAVKADTNFKVIDKFQAYIKPQLYRKLNPYMQEKTNLTIEKLDEAGKPFPMIIKEFINWVGKDFILYAWGIDDIRELKNNCKFYEVDIEWLKEYIDIQKLFSNVNKLPNRVSLQKAVESLEINMDAAFHTAINDAEYTLEIFKKISKRISQQDS